MMTPERRKEINHIGYCNDKAVRKAIKECFEEIDLLKEENRQARELLQNWLSPRITLCACVRKTRALLGEES